MVKTDKSQSLILNRILSLNKKVLFISLSNSSTWTNSRISLFNRFISSFYSATLFLLEFNVDIWSKFPGTNSFKHFEKSFSSLLKWLLYAALLLFFFNRTSFPKGASSLPLRDILPKRQLKPQTNKKKTNYFLTKHQSRKIKLFLKKQQYHNILQFYLHHSIYIRAISPFTKANHQNVKTTTPHHTIILLSTVQFRFVQFYLSLMWQIFSI